MATPKSKTEMPRKNRPTTIMGWSAGQHTHAQTQARREETRWCQDDRGQGSEQKRKPSHLSPDGGMVAELAPSIACQELKEGKERLYSPRIGTDVFFWDVGLEMLNHCGGFTLSASHHGSVT